MMNEDINKSIDQLMVDDTAVKESAKNIAPLDPNALINEETANQDITAFDESDSAFTGEEENVAILGGLKKGLKVIDEALTPSDTKILNKSVFDQINPTDPDYIVTPYESIDVKKVLDESKDYPTGGKAAPIPKRGKGDKVNRFNIDTIQGQESLGQFINFVGDAYPANLQTMSIKELAQELSTPTFSIIQDGMPIKKFKTEKEAVRYMNEQPNPGIFSLQQEQLYSPKFLEDILNPRKKTLADPVYVRKMLLAQVDVASKTDAMARKIIKAEADGTLTVNMQVDFDQMFALMGELSKAIEGRTSDVGRTLRMFGEARGATGNLAKLNILEAQGAGVNSVGRARKFLALETVDKKGKAASMRFSFTTAPDIMVKMWQTTWINGLLSGPITHVQNMVSNLAYGAWQVPVRYTASKIGNVRKKLFPEGESAIPSSEAHEFAANYFGSSYDSFKLGIKAFKQNAPLDGSASKLELDGAQNIFNSVDYGDTMFGKTTRTGMAYWGKFVTLPGRALLAEDEMFKGMARFAQFKALAGRARHDYIDTLTKEGKLSYEQIVKQSDSYYQDIINNPPEDLIKQSVDFSKEVTFTKELEGKMLELQKTINENKAMSMGPLLKMFIPFVRTPTNLVTEALRNSPGAILLPSFRKAILAGGKEADLALAKVGVGSALMATVAGFSWNGNITGAGPRNKELKKTYEATGWRPYSIVFDAKDWNEEGLAQLRTYGLVTQGEGKIYWSYNRLQPLSTILGVGASIGEYFMANSYANSQGYGSDSLTKEILSIGVMSIYDIVKEAPQLQGIAELIDTIGSGKDQHAVLTAIDSAFKKAGEFAIQGSPAGIYQSGKATIERYLDPTSSNLLPSEGDNAWDYSIKKYKSRLPFYSDDLPPRLDPLTGEEVSIGLGNFYEMFSPFKKSTGEYIAGYQTLINWGVEVYVPPYRKDKYELTADQYNAWIRLATADGDLQYKIDSIGEKFDAELDVGAVQSKLKATMQKAYQDAFKELQNIYPEIEDFYGKQEMREEVVGKTRFN